MKYDDLEKTKDLFNIEGEVPSPIENLEMEGVNKDNITEEILEEGLPEEEHPKKEKKKKEKKSFKEKWQKMPKKKKILLIVSLVIILALIIAVILFFILKKDDKEKDKPKDNPTNVVIVETENYVYQNGTLTFINEDKDELGTYECQNKDEKLCYVVDYNDEDDFDTPRNVFEDESLISRKSIIYDNRYVFVYDNDSEKNGVVTLYDMKENKTEGIYKLVKGFSNSNYVILKNSTDKYGAVELTESGIKEKIGFTFDYLGRMDKDSKIVAKTNNKYFIYSNDGKLESKGLDYEIKSYNNNYIIADNNGYYIYDYKSSLLIDESYDYARLLDDYVILIKDKKLFVKDYKNNKYNEEGITLDNEYYNDTNIYNDKKKLIETKKAFGVSIDDNGINIDYKNKNTEKTKTIVKSEGKLSSELTFMNYFDGNLYFYNDEEKMNLIGKYTCSNKNNGALTNCFVATESYFSANEVEGDFSEHVGTIPIFSERYVFVNDTLDPNNPNINLYDLKNNKILSKYSGVDAGSYTGENKLTFSENKDAYIIAKNKNNKFGVINIKEEVKSIIAFNYNKIEKIHDYYMAHENSDTYILVDNTGKVLTSKYGYKITDYKDEYLVATHDDYYYIYDFKGNKLDESKFYDIKLYDGFYVVIDINKKLDIRKYNDPSYSLFTPIEVDETNYKIDYEVEKTKTGFTVKVKSSNRTYTVDSYGFVDNDRLPSVIDPSN